MPPSHHSHSSHSSHSHSSSHSSHSHSSSSHSSRSSSYSSAPSYPSKSPYTKDGSAIGYIIPRTLTNQPTGFRSSGLKPRHHYCRYHNYTYYPIDWVSGDTSYKKGYYDENGVYYQDISFEKNGKYDDVICKCLYCGSTSKIVWEDGAAIRCPQCGGDVEVQTFCDAYTQDPDYTAYQERSQERSGRTGKTLLAVFLGYIGVSFVLPVMAIFTFSFWEGFARGVTGSSGSSGSSVSNTDIYGTTIYLRYVGPNTYKITDDTVEYDKKLTWDYGYDSYYDKQSDCYIWYNTDVSPNLWQYWYEGISSDYGDYGWMEYEPTGWYIEKSEGNWVSLPSGYDTSELWHIEIDAKDFDVYDDDAQTL